MVKVQSSSATRELVSYEEQSRHGRLKESTGSETKCLVQYDKVAVMTARVDPAGMIGS